MRNILTVARRELASYFTSPIAYIFLAIAAIIFGFFFYSIVAVFVSRALQATRFGGMPPAMNINEMIFRPLLMNVAVTSLFLTPMLTMRLYSEERKVGTLELLLTSPVSDWDILLGKFLGALTLYGGLIFLVLIYFIRNLFCQIHFILNLYILKWFAILLIIFYNTTEKELEKYLFYFNKSGRIFFVFSRDFSSLHCSINFWFPDRSISGTFHPL